MKKKKKMKKLFPLFYALTMKLNHFSKDHGMLLRNSSVFRIVRFRA